MPTRRQDPANARFDQSGCASSPEFERGVLGNLVAARCQQLTDRKEIAVLWWLQQVSWREGGLQKFAANFLRESSDAPKGAFDWDGQRISLEVNPSEIVEEIQKALVDPAHSLREGFYRFPNFWRELLEIRERESSAAAGVITETAVTRQVFEELDFALETRSFILVEGREGIGKTEAARNWCDQHPGRAIYVRLEAGVDETTLYRSIARRIGTACSYRRKAIEMRARIQDALQAGHLALV
jgi:hypothetical protein